MNRITRIAALALTVAAAGSAFADDITIDTTPQTSLKTRAEVQVELAQFQQQRVNPWSSSYNVLAGFQSSQAPGPSIRQILISNRPTTASRRW